ncbi:MAG: ATPase [Clostridiales Family XIII bacterium]|jgi:pilus assembly protein CpaF|nr:ATPase [Clostridiales Family XIII bacterium]
MKMNFEEACDFVENSINGNGKEAGVENILELQKKAIMGHKEEMEILTAAIKEIVEREELDFDFPNWHESSESAIFHEVWGLAGMAEWFGAAYKESGSAKIIGERIYFMDSGRLKLMPQRMDQNRRGQLIRAFLLITPDERLDRDFHEIYLLDGTRITIFKDRMTKENQDAIIFRRYIVPEYSFEQQAKLGTIPEAAIPLFEEMVKIGFNVAFCGSVRSAKTTFLSTWQSYEDPRLEGVMVETDPEVPLHKIMPDAPIVQLLADGDVLKSVSKNLLRSDADYFVMAEVRDGNALDVAVRVARKGTGRMKITYHTRDPRRFAEDAAVEIVRATGGDVFETALRVADSFDMVFHFAAFGDRGEKRLLSINEMSADNGEIRMNEICRFNPAAGTWDWKSHISASKASIMERNAPESFRRFRRILAELSEIGRVKKYAN